MANLAQARQRSLAKARAAQQGETRTSVINQIRAEGYEDYSYAAEFASNPYKGDEAEAYMQGWNQARLEMEGK